MLIITPEFKSNLTGKTYLPNSYEPLDCSTENVIYGIECTLCGLIYVGETEQTLRSRMNTHRYDSKNTQYRALYNHFNQPGHDQCLNMKVRFIEKIYHHTNSPKLSKPYRTDRELFWIKELGTAMPYGCNDNIKGIGNLSSPGNSDINVMKLFNTYPRQKRSHGKRPQKPRSKDPPDPNNSLSLKDRYTNLLSSLQQPLGVHYIRTNLFSLPVTLLKDLRDFALDEGGADPFSTKYRLSSIISDVAQFRLFKPVKSEPLHNDDRKFIHIPFSNKGIDAINISNILHRQKVLSKVPPYFKNQSVPIVSYSYTKTIGSRIFNHKKTLQNLNIEEYLKCPLTCDCTSSPFNYSPSGHVITGDLNIIENESLRNVISHGPKFREPQRLNWNLNFKTIMDAIEDYARSWIKREKEQEPEVESLSDWVRTIRSLVQGRIANLRKHTYKRPKSVFNDHEALDCLSSLQDKYVIVPADKASNNIVFVCKAHYLNCLIKELGIDKDTPGNTTYKRTTFDKDEILNNHKSFMSSLNINTKCEDLPYLYWIPKLHKNPYKERYIAGSSSCSTKEMSIHLTKILSAVKDGQQACCDTIYSRSGINHMWILKNSKDLLENLKSRSFSEISSIKTFDFSTLYTTLPHDKLKSRLKELIHKAFNNSRNFVVLGYNSTYFSKTSQKNKTCYTKKQVCDMLDFLIDNIFVTFGGAIFQQQVGIPMGTNCAPLLADLFLYSYETEFLQNLVRNKNIKDAKSFNFTYRYIDDVLSINNPSFAKWLPSIYPPELEIKETTETTCAASFLDLHLEFDSSGKLSTKIYDKRDDFDFKIINFPYLCSNIPTSPAYGVYISQLIRYARACTNYSDFLERHKNLRTRLLSQEYEEMRLQRSLTKFFFKYQNLVEKYSVSSKTIIEDCFL